MNMRYLILIFNILISIQLLGQNSQPKIDLVNDKDEIIDTIGVDGRKYIRFYREVTTDILDLDFDDYPDTIIWFNYLEQSIERNDAFYDPGQQIKIRNKQGELKIRGDWYYIDKKFKKYSDTVRYKQDDFVIYLKLDSKTTGMILAHQLYASDIDAYTIIGINSLKKPKVLFDATYILTSIEDLDNDGYCELIGKHPNAGIPEHTLNFVPFVVLKYTDSLKIDNGLTYNYNLPYKKYRDYPEGSIRLLTEDYLKKYTKDELRLMRNEIFADHGYVFKSKDLNDYFKSKDWYKASPNGYFVLTDWEKSNIELIKKMENN